MRTASTHLCRAARGRFARFCGLSVALLALGVEAQLVTLPSVAKGSYPKLTGGLGALAAHVTAKALPAQKATPGAILSVEQLQLLPIRGDQVVIDAVAQGNTNALRRDLIALGLTNATVYKRTVSGLLPVDRVPALNQIRGLCFARPALCGKSAGLVTSQGDVAQYSYIPRLAFGFDGTGVKVGVLSDSFDYLGGAIDDVLSDDLPWDLDILDDSGGDSDEGRAMMQIVHDVAPGAALAFHTAYNGQADFAQGIIDLAYSGCRVIVDDVFYYAEPYFQDGIIAQAVDEVKRMGVTYFSSAGNQARQSYESVYRETPYWTHDFDPDAGEDDLLTITVPTGYTVLIVQWDDPFYSVSGAPGAATDLDLYFFDMDGNPLGSSLDWNVGHDPIEGVGITNPGPPWQIQVMIQRWEGPLPGRVKMIWYSDMAVEYPTDSSTIVGHANAAGAEAVGAARYDATPAWGVNPPVLEYFSSAGATPILFSTTGSRLASPEWRVKPGIVAPDGGNNTFFGGDYEPDGWPNFFGTSASAPHAAGAAALMVQASRGTIAPEGVFDILRGTAVDMADPDFDNDTGYGLIQADYAVAEAIVAPDLVVPVLAHASPSQVERYLAIGQVYLRCQQKNQGTFPSQGCRMNIWFTTDPPAYGDDDFAPPPVKNGKNGPLGVLLRTVSVRPLAPGQSAPAQTMLLRLPQRLLPGDTAYIIAEVDSGDVVNEVPFEGNNTTVLTLGVASGDDY